MPDSDAWCGRKRAGIILLIAGTSAIAIIAMLSAIVGDRTVFLYASPIYALCVTIALILLTTGPRNRQRNHSLP